MKKIIVLGIMLLFLGLAVAPSMNANITKDNELVEFTIEICGLEGGKHTVQLSRGEAKEVDQLFNDIEKRVGKVETREKTIEIFNDALVELDKYGLLGGLSVKQAQKLVTGGFKNNIMMKIYENINNKWNLPFGDDENYLCLILGLCGGFLFFSSIWFNAIATTLLNFYNSFEDPSYFLSMAIGIIVMLMGLFDLVNPFCIGRFIHFDEYANGIIVTLGLNGLKTWKGNFSDLMSGTYYESYGISGFTGLKIFNGLDKYANESRTLLIGSALHVKIGES